MSYNNTMFDNSHFDQHTSRQIDLYTDPIEPKADEDEVTREDLEPFAEWQRCMQSDCRKGFDIENIYEDQFFKDGKDMYVRCPCCCEETKLIRG